MADAKLLTPDIPNAAIVVDYEAAGSIAKRFKSGAAWSILTAVASRGITLVSTMLLARILGQMHFGEYGLVLSTVTTFGTVAGLGLQAATTKWVAELRVVDPERTGRIVRLSTALALIGGTLVALPVFALSETICGRLFGSTEFAFELRISTISIVLLAWNSVQVGVLAGLEAYRSRASFSILSSLIGLPIPAALALLFGITGAVSAYVICQLIICFLLSYCTTRQLREFAIPVSWTQVRSELPAVLSLSLPNILAGLFTGPFIWLAQCMLAQYHDFGEQAVYSVGAQWRYAIASVPALLTTAYLPVAASIRKQDTRKRMRLFYSTALIGLASSVAIGSVVALCSKPIMLSYGESFLSGLNVLLIMLLVAIADSVNQVLIPTMLSCDKAWHRIVGNIAWGAVFLVSCWFLIPKYGAVGLACSLLFGQLALIAVQFPIAIRAILGVASNVSEV